MVNMFESSGSEDSVLGSRGKIFQLKYIVLSYVFFRFFVAVSPFVYYVS